MEALKRSLAEGGKAPAVKRKVGAGDRRQGHMLLPVEGGKSKAAEKAEPAAKPRAAPRRARKKAS